MKKHIVIDARESGTSTGRYIDKLIEYLHQLNPDYKITLLAKKHRLEFLQKTAPKFDVKVTRFKEFTFGEQIGFLRQIKSLKPDLVFFPAAQQPILYRGKVVTTIQDLTTIRFRNPSKNWLIFTIKRWVYVIVNKIVGRKSVGLITPTEFVKNDFAKFAHVNSRRITVTYEAGDAIKDTPEPIKELEGKQFIMYLGRPMPHKNLPRLIEAFANLRQTNPELRLVLAGKKDGLYKQIERDVHSKRYGNVMFTDFVSEGQLRWLYENTALYVFPSLSEGFGLPPIEAMIHGAPVASSNATCLPEVNKDGAVYFDPLDIEDMAGVIKRVLSDQKLRQKLIANGSRVASQYSWKRMAEQTLSVFNKVIDK